MQIESQAFGKTEIGENAELFTLTNDIGAFVKITNNGGIITEIFVPDKNGQLINVVLGFDKLQEYFSDIYKKTKPYFGAIIGRYGNRIANGQFQIDGKKYQVPCNLGKHALHGGFNGFDQKIWKASAESGTDKVSLKLACFSKHLEEGFPGNLKVEVTYSWNNACVLSIDYQATTDQKTHINLTNHSYFNLNGGKENVLNHQVSIQSDVFTEVDEEAIPTGKLKKVDDSCMDFRKPKRIGEHINDVQSNGYDHNFVLNDVDGTLKFAASAYDESSGIKLETLTTEPAVQFFTANHLDGTLSRENIKFTKHSGFCFETQHFPDSPNQPKFPPTLLNPSEKFKSRTVYKFSISNKKL